MCLAGSCRGKTTTCGSPSRERGLLAACPGAPSRTPGNGPCQLHFPGTGHPWCIFWIVFKTQRPCRFLAKILLFRLGVSRQKFISNIQELLEIDIGNTIGWFLFPSQSLKKKNPISTFKCCCWGCKLLSSHEHNVLSHLLALHWQLMGLFAQPRQPLEQQKKGILPLRGCP